MLLEDTKKITHLGNKMLFLVILKDPIHVCIVSTLFYIVSGTNMLDIMFPDCIDLEE